MNKVALLAFVAVASASLTPVELDPCATAICAPGLVCVADPPGLVRQCLPDSFCPNFSCVSPADAACAATTCPENFECVYSPKQCFTTPCPQTECVPSACQLPEATCGDSEVCISSPKMCIRAPCPQHGCVDSSECGKFCTQDFTPVCGSDGQTYSNECALEVAVCQKRTMITVIHEGACETDESECPRFCTEEYAPICGSNDQTYSNECFLKQDACETDAQITVAYKGECKKCGLFRCSNEYIPVCGTDGKTYTNACQLQNTACNNKDFTLNVAFEGPCSEKECSGPCTLEYDPQCGANGVTYGNKCAFRQAVCASFFDDEEGTLTLANEGECVRPTPCPEMCPMNYQPVCGTDLKTYGNACGLNVATCKTKGDISLLHEGPCVPADCDGPCTKEFNPQCGSDGVTYGNPCMFRIAACKARILGKTLSLEKAGTCPLPCPKYCTREFKPVCGTDLRSYSNECEMRRMSCNLPYDYEISVLHEGQCTRRDCNKFCGAEVAPICAMRYVGPFYYYLVSFRNVCEFQVADCKAQDAYFFLHNGAC